MSEEVKHAISEKRLENLYWAGGEPMISNVHWDVIEYIAELRADLADFLRSSGSTLKPGLLPKEEIAWNLLPVFFIATWIAFWILVAGPEVF